MAGPVDERDDSSYIVFETPMSPSLSHLISQDQWTSVVLVAEVVMVAEEVLIVSGPLRNW